MKLSVFAKRMEVCYQTAWNWHKRGLIPGACTTITGMILVPDDAVEVMKGQNRPQSERSIPKEM